MNWIHRQEPRAYVLNYIIILLLSLIVIVTADVHTVYNTTRKEIILIYAIRVSLSRRYTTYILSPKYVHTRVEIQPAVYRQ